MTIKERKLKDVLDNLIDDQRRQMVKYIDEYEETYYDFWAEMKAYIDERHYPDDAYGIFSDMVISYFRIKNR